MEIDPFGDNGVFLNVLPPGSADANDRNIATDPNSTNQLVMYENLVFSDSYPAPGQLNDGDLAPVSRCQASATLRSRPRL
jgi:hypothetical protein